MEDIIDRMIDLQEQATKEKSHHYTKEVLKEAIQEILSLRRWKDNHQRHLLEELEEVDSGRDEFDYLHR